jgi:hypothetical protein
MSTGGMGSLRLKTSCQFTPAKNGCYLSSYESRVLPNLFFGSLHNSFFIISFAYVDIFLGIFNGPLN